MARGLIVGLALLYCILVVALGLLWTLRADSAWWLALSNVFALYAFAPLLLLAPAALLIGSRWLRAATALPLAVFLALFGARLLPPLGEQPAGQRLRVMTINQLYTNRQVDALIAAIRTEDADIVAIQELSPRLAAAAEQQLRAEYPYQSLMTNDSYDLGILSRYPLREVVREPRFTAQRAIVEIDGLAITLLNAHPHAPQIATRRLRQFRPVKVVLNYDTSRRARELPQLLETIDAVQGPLIVLGDLNTSDREPPYADLAARLHDAYRETAWGFGFTFPNNQRLARLPVPFPLVRIDYIWSGRGVLPAAARVTCASGGSDHSAVVADLRVGVSDVTRSEALERR
jgi:endonuclease/exonuclease/phosphatase (EEP) superfamily protein YafD